MKLSELYNAGEFAGTVDTLVSGIKTLSPKGEVVVAFMGGGDSSVNLVPLVLDENGKLDLSVLKGTALSPAEFLIGRNGERIPGALFNNLATIKAGYNKDKAGNLIDGTYFWDLDGIVAMVNAYAVTGKEEHFTKARHLSVEAAAQVFKTEIAERHAGVELRSVAAFDPRVPEGEHWISYPMADMLLSAMQVKYGGKAPKTYKELCGLRVRDRRYPFQDLTCVPTLRLRVIKDHILANRINDGTIKRQEGDFDGDQLEDTFNQGYVGSDQYYADLGTLSMVEAYEDPEYFGTPSFNLSMVRAHDWPTSVMTAAGMGTKALQGVLTNGFSELGIAAVVKFQENPELITRLLSGRETDHDDLRFKPQAWIYDEFRKGLAPATSICLDYRKYKESDPDDDTVPASKRRYARQLWNMVETFSGQDDRFAESVKLVDKSGKTIDVDLANGLLDSLEEPLKVFLSRYPVQGALVGDIDLSTLLGRAKMRRLMSVIAREGLPQFLKYACGVEIEKALDPLKGPKDTKADKNPVLIGFGKKTTPWDFTQESDWEYITRHAFWAGGKGVRIVRTEGGIVIKCGPGQITLDSCEFTPHTPKDHDRTGFIVVKRGTEKRYSRLILRSDNKNFGPSAEVLSVSLVTLLDLIGEYLADQDYWGTRNQKEKEDFNLQAFEADVLKGVETLIDSYSRLPGQTDKDKERVKKEVNLSDMQVSIMLGQGNTPRQSMERNTALLTAIDEGEFVNPLDPMLMQTFDVGYGSKTNPGTAAMLRSPGTWRSKADGTFGWFTPIRPLMAYAVNVWLDTDRQMRESLSVRMACELTSPESLMISSGFEHVLPAITKCRRDGVWVAVDGLKAGFFSKEENNGDMGRLTPHGMQVFARKSRPEVLGPIKEEVADKIAAEKLGEGKTHLDLVALGWNLERSGRRLGRWARKTVYESLVTLTGPSIGAPTWNKVYLCGHKFVAMPTTKDYYVQVGEELLPVVGFLPVESLISKKMTGTMAAGLAAILGRRYFGKFAECLVSPDRKEGDDPEAHDDIVKECSLKLKEAGLPMSGCLPLRDADGMHVGEGFPMILPGFVLREDDKISTGCKADGASNSLLTLRGLGEVLSVDGHLDTRIGKRGAYTLTVLAQFLEGNLGDGSQLTELTGEVAEAVEDNLETLCEDCYVPDEIPEEEVYDYA